MKRVREESVAQWRRPAPSADVNAKIERRLQRSFTAGMSREQGSETFYRVLTHGRSPQIIVSTRDLDEAMQEAGALNRTRLLAEIESLGSAQPEHARPDLSSAYTEPEDELERRIAVIWQRVLGIDRVGIYDNFFELGGTSLNGVQLVAELKKELNMDIPTVSIFEASTVAALAKYLRPGQDQVVFERVQTRAQLKKQALGTAQRLRTGAKQ